MFNQPEISAKKRVLDLEVAKAKQGVGELPQHIVTMYDKANSMGSGRLKALRKMAPDAVEQIPGKNKYRLTVQKPVFEQWREKEDKNTAVLITRQKLTCL